MNNNNKIYNIALVGILTALIAVSAFIRIPTPFSVPYTMQVLVVLLAPMIVGPKLAFLAMLQYLIIGLAGIPIFANGGGPAYVLQPTFGFLLGFLVSVIPNGIISQIGGRFVWYLLGGFSAIVVYNIFGSIGFWLNMNHIQGREFTYVKALTVSVLPFIAFDFTRLVLAAIIAPKLKKIAGK